MILVIIIMIIMIIIMIIVIIIMIIMIVMINIMMMESYVDYGQGGGYGDDIMMLIINSLWRHCLLTAVLKFEQN